MQIIMASRMLYGLSRKGMAPSWFGHLHGLTQTPINATLFAAVTILIFALWLPLVKLAQLTSFITLLIFSLINLALLVIKFKSRKLVSNEVKPNVYQAPYICPILGFLLSLTLLISQLIY